MFLCSSLFFSSVQFSSVAQSCPTLCDPMNRSTPGLPVHHQLPEFTQTHVHRVSDAIQPSHPLSSPYSPSSNPSQHQSLFQWVNSSHEVAKVLEFPALALLYRISWVDLIQSGLQWLPWSSSFIISMTSFLLNILSWMAHANLKHISKYTYLLSLLLPFKLQICFSFCALISVNSTTNYKCYRTWNFIIILILIFFLHLMNHQGLSILWPVSKDYPLLSNLSTIIVVRALIQFLLDYCSSFLIIENTTYA